MAPFLRTSRAVKKNLWGFEKGSDRIVAHARRRLPRDRFIGIATPLHSPEKARWGYDFVGHAGAGPCQVERSIPFPLAWWWLRTGLRAIISGEWGGGGRGHVHHRERLKGLAAAHQATRKQCLHGMCHW